MASDQLLALVGNGGLPTTNDADLFSHIERHLSTALISDALDEMGVRDRAMREHLRPLEPNAVVTGRARTILCMDLYHIQESPYAKEIEAVDSILPGEVVVIATAESKRNAPWGELLSTAAEARGARGAVIDGLIRDTKKILALRFPVFAAGFKPVDSKGRGAVVDYNVPVECAGVLVQPGDLIVGDVDGVVAVPADMVDEVVRVATDKASRENTTRAELNAGAYLRDAFAKYGVLYRIMSKLAALTCLLWAGVASLHGAGPLVFPKPRQIEFLNNRLTLAESVPILLPTNPSPDDLFLARFLAGELSDRYGVALHTRRVTSIPPDGAFILLGSAANPLVREYLSGHEQPPAEKEGYILEVTDRTAVVAGTDASGAFYGLQSLRQLIERGPDAVSIHGARIRDWPFLPFRGVKLYLPGHENIAYFKRFVRDVMALYKYNQLMLEMNAAMRFDRHPELNAGWIEFSKNMKYTRRERSPGPGRQFQDSANADTADGEVLEKAEVTDLVAYAHQFHIDVIPEIPSLTHSYYLLSRHRELAEIQDAEWPDTYCPSEPRVYELLFNVLDEYIDVMKPTIVHIGHDEWRMPLGVCPRCKGKDPTQLYAADVNRIYDHLHSRGVAVTMYGDHLIEALRGKRIKHNENRGGEPYDMPGGLSAEQVEQLIPKDILIFNWFWDSRGNEDLDAEGLGRKNEADLSDWGFRQVFGNFESHFPDFDRRVARHGIIGGMPESWAATDELNLGKDMMFDILGCANLLWSTDRPDMAQLSAMVQELMPGVRSRLSREPLPSWDTAPVPVPTKSSEAVRVDADASSLIFHHACRKRGRNQSAYEATWNFADTAELLGWYEVEYEDGFVHAVPVRYGVNILEADWLRSPTPRSLAYEAQIEPHADGNADFAFEWINPRMGIAIREVRLHSVSPENPVTLSGLSMVPKLSAPQPKPLRLAR